MYKKNLNCTVKMVQDFHWHVILKIKNNNAFFAGLPAFTLPAADVTGPAQCFWNH